MPEVHRRAPGLLFALYKVGEATLPAGQHKLLLHVEVIVALFLLAVPLASCSGRAVRLYFVLVTVGSMIMTVVINARYLIFMHFYVLAFLASCSTRSVRRHFVLCKGSSIIMTVAINARYLIFMHFYALAFLASCSTRSVRLHFVLCKGSSIIMNVAINAHYLPLMTSTPWRFWLCALQGAGGYASCCTTQTTASRSRSSSRSSFQRCLWLHALGGQ